MAHKAAHLLSFMLVLATVSSAREIRRESADLAVTILDADGEAGRPRLVIEHRRGGRSATVELNNRTDVVGDVLVVRPDRIVVRGKLSRQYLDEIFTVVGADANRIIDTVWARGAAVSPDTRTVAYQYRSTPTTQGELWAALVVYDLTATPQENTAAGAEPDLPSERGVVVYPEEHRVAQRYWFLLDHDAAPQRSFASPIAWSADSKRIAVVEREGNLARLVTVDLSNGVRQPVVAVVPVGRDEDVLAARYGGVPPKGYRNAHVWFASVRFSEDGSGVIVTPRGTDLFPEKTVTLPVPSAAR